GGRRRWRTRTAAATRQEPESQANQNQCENAGEITVHSVTPFLAARSRACGDTSIPCSLRMVKVSPLAFTVRTTNTSWSRTVFMTPVSSICWPGVTDSAPLPSKPNRPRLASSLPETVSTMRWQPQIIPGAGLSSTLDTVPLSVTSWLTSYRESESAALSGTTRIANRRPVSSPAIGGVELMKRLCLMDSLLSRLPHHRPSARCTTLQREKCASNLVSAPLVFLLLQPCPLFHYSRARRLAEHEESLASINYDDVVAVCAVRIEVRPRTIRIDRVGSVRSGLIGPGSDFTAGASGVANGAARPTSAVEGDANLGDGAAVAKACAIGTAHKIVHSHPVEGILPFEAGNATDLTLGMNVGDDPWNAGRSREERETCHEKKILSELVHV